MTLGRAVAAAAGFAAMLMVAPTAGAGPGYLKHPDAVSLKLGTSGSSDDAAVALVGLGDDQYYDVESSHTKLAMSYTVTFKNIGDTPPDLKVQWEGHRTTLPCDLTVSVYRWDKQRWVGTTLPALGASDVFVDTGSWPRKQVVSHHKARGRISCKADTTFALRSDQVRLIAG